MFASRLSPFHEDIYRDKSTTELEEELKSTCDVYEEEIAVLLEKNEDLKKKLGIFMGDPAPEEDIRSEDYIIIDDTDSDPTVVMMIMKTKLERISWSLPPIKISSRPPYY